MNELLEIRNIELRRADDGHWLTFKTYDGKRGAINIENMFNGPNYTHAAIREWAKEQRLAAPTVTVTVPKRTHTLSMTEIDWLLNDANVLDFLAMQNDDVFANTNIVEFKNRAADLAARARVIRDSTPSPQLAQYVQPIVNGEMVKGTPVIKPGEQSPDGWIVPPTNYTLGVISMGAIIPSAQHTPLKWQPFWLTPPPINSDADPIGWAHNAAHNKHSPSSLYWGSVLPAHAANPDEWEPVYAAPADNESALTEAFELIEKHKRAVSEFKELLRKWQKTYVYNLKHLVADFDRLFGIGMTVETAIRLLEQLDPTALMVDRNNKPILQIEQLNDNIVIN